MTERVADSLMGWTKLDGFVCPPEFWPALGYPGDARYVAIYWEQCGDEAAWADGRQAFAGAFWPAYQALMHQNFSPGHPYHWLLGSSDGAAVFWLVIDRETENAWIVPTIQAEEIVRAQWPAAAEDVAVDWETLDLEEMVRELRETAPLDMAEIDRRLAEEEVRYSDLIAALEARPPRWQKENRLTPG